MKLWSDLRWPWNRRPARRLPGAQDPKDAAEQIEAARLKRIRRAEKAK